MNFLRVSTLRADRLTGRGGGVVLYIKEDIQYKVINSIPDSSDFQTIFVEIENPHSRNVVVGVTYRPPYSSIDSFTNYLETCLDSLTRNNKHIYLMGNFNINLNS